MSNLDQIRTRLLTLNASVNKLRENIATGNPLPSWSSLQTHANLISNNLQSIAEQLAQQQQTLSATQAFPLPQYPGRYQGMILETLLRTKLEPNVEDWLEQGRQISDEDSGKGTIPQQDRDTLWQWAPSAANDEARKQKWGADYTLAEKQNGIENVVTGLKRELIEPPDDIDDDEEDDYDDASEDEEDEDKMDIEQPRAGADVGSNGSFRQAVSTPQMPLETIHRFMSTGKVG